MVICTILITTIVIESVDHICTYMYTSCPARRCLGIRAPLNFVPSLEASCGSAQLCCFAPVARLNFLASESTAQPTDNPIEKLCSALASVGFKQRAVFEW